MSDSLKRKSKQWEMLLDKISSKLEQVKLALAAIHSRSKNLEEQEAKILDLKKQYSSSLHSLETKDHGIEEATRLRKFMIHLDKTLNVIKRETFSVEKEKSTVNEEFIKLEKERLKFETLKKRADENMDAVVSRKENIERDLSNSLRYTKTRR